VVLATWHEITISIFLAVIAALREKNNKHNFSGLGGFARENNKYNLCSHSGFA